MTFPFWSLVTQYREAGLVVAVLLGFVFGFVLERAGFGRAPRLAAQFYFRDLTVLKVMFGAIVTAMLGLVALAGFGLVDLRALANNGASPTYLWPMLVGGLLLGVGFIVAGYCPGTSIVAAASGNWDGLLTLIGVIAGTWVYSEAQSLPAVARFHVSNDFGNFYLYDLLRLPPPVVAAGVVLMALGMFVGADLLEGLAARRRRAEPPPSPPVPRRFAFALVSMLGAVAVLTLAIPHGTGAAGGPVLRTVSQAELARRILEEAWTLRILDLRPERECAIRRIPGAECIPAAFLARLNLRDDPGVRDLVLVGAADVAGVPAEAADYPGRIYRLEGGFQGWVEYALTKPAPPPAPAGAGELAAYRFRASVHEAMVALKPAPPPPPPAAGAGSARKKSGGGCSS
ncbi:MAG TPA: YeeE/YedE thiosulfate transporter family protein [Methylomirabilota bacterium]|nr:YeeE/YedE thiosulfate transporter family protein [Methylomirabilota bacterium]